MKVVLAVALAAISLSSSVTAAPLEADALIPAGWTKSRAQAVANDSSGLIRAARYRCDTVSSVRIWSFSVGFTITCNGFRYKYEIEDKGGRWVVTLQ